MSQIDPSLLQDFLTESSELIELLDGDLVRLESAEAPAEAQELCNSCFRALHTIKGAASFLGLTAVTGFAHVAEDTLNRLRKGEVQVTEAVMDALLQSADVVRSQIEALSSGEEAPEAPDELIERLKALCAAGGASSDEQDADAGDEPAEPASDDGGGQPLSLPAQKLDLLEFMVADMREQAQQIEGAIQELESDATREEAAAHLSEIAETLVKTVDFFELPDLTAVARLLEQTAPKLGRLPGDAMTQITVRLRGIRWLIEQQADALQRQRALSWPLERLTERLNQLAEGQELPAEARAERGDDPVAALKLDGVLDAAESDAGAADGAEGRASGGATPAPGAGATSTEPAEPDGGDAADKPAAGRAGASAVEQTIRVEVGRLEALLNLVGQLVLNKNRVLALTRNLRDHELPQELTENVTSAASDLDRLTSELQVGVMRTRMQPLAKLFDRYPRVIRDIARMTHKKIDLEITGKDTEVDKSVLELLADPLVHILRNSADHGIEEPAQRVEAGKAEVGKIRLEAEHQGSHVRVAIIDDGKGLDREVIGTKAVERGLATAEQVAQLSDSDVFRFIFEAGFSTAAVVSDLSGRGVGMDVVRTNVTKLNGTINIDSTRGQGTTIEILIPLTVAIMPAMVVGVGRHLYAIPLQSIVEIVRPEQCVVRSVHGHPVMRLRDAVLPLVDLRQRLNEVALEGAGRFAVVVAVGGHRAGLIVDKLVGQKEIVIKPLDDECTAGGPFSGATIQENGEVSLILDVVQLLKSTGSASAPPAPTPTLQAAA